MQSTYEGETTLRSLKVGLESESTLLVDLSTSDTGLLALVLGEVSVHKVEALLVNLLVYKKG